MSDHTIVIIWVVKTFFVQFFCELWTVNFLMYKLVLEKAEEPEIKLPTSAGSSKKRELQKNI